MTKVLINITAGSKVEGVFVDNEDLKDVIVKEAENTPVRMPTNFNPDLVTEEEAKCLITSDRLAELETQDEEENEAVCEGDGDVCDSAEDCPA